MNNNVYWLICIKKYKIYVQSLKTSTLPMHEFCVIVDLSGNCCKLISFVMGFECHPSDVETVMHERNDVMTKVPNMRFKQISQHCGALVEILMRFRKRLKLGTH